MISLNDSIAHGTCVRHRQRQAPGPTISSGDTIETQEFSLKALKHLLTGVVLSCVTLLSHASLAIPAYSSLVVFGDSLSDSGNNSLHPLIGSAPLQIISGNGYVPAQTYASGTYSNGPVWATQFASMLGLSAGPSLAGGTNYAYGGAVTGVDQILHPSFPQFPLPGLKTQANTFLAAPGPVDISSALFVVAGGGNNARATFASQLTQTNTFSLLTAVTNAADAYANDVGTIVDQLQAGGAQNIIVWNTPDLGLAPAIKQFSTTGTFLSGSQLGSLVSTTNNGALDLRLAGEAGVQVFDLYGLVALASANGFTNTTDACGAAANSEVCPNIATALFWDGIHPTTAAHGLIAQQMFALTAPVPEPSTYAMLFVGLLVITSVVRRRSN